MSNIETIQFIDSLKRRWKTEAGIMLRQDILKSRFFLSMQQKIHAFNDESLAIDLRGIDLTSMSLRDFMLYGTDMKWSNFRNSELNGPIQNTDMSFATLENSKIESVHFLDVEMIACIFDGAAFQKTTFQNVNAKQASFKDVNFSGTNFHTVDFRGAKFQGASFKECLFRKVKLDKDTQIFWERFEKNECRFEKIEWCDSLSFHP